MPNKAEKSHTVSVDFINDILETEYEILSCINACNMAQKRAIKLMDELRLSHIVQFDQSLTKKTRGTNSLSLIQDTLQALRCKLEQRLTSQDYTNPFRFIPNAIKHSIKSRAFIEKLNHFKSILKSKQADKEKYDELILQNHDDECVDLLLEERMKTEMEIECLMHKMKKIKKELAEQYGSVYGKEQHQSSSEEIEVGGDDKKISIAVQTSSALCGFKNDCSAQTLQRSFKSVTLCTQTRIQSLIYTRNNENTQTSNDDIKRQVENWWECVDIEPKQDDKSWYRQDLELPMYCNGGSKKKKMPRFMTKWYFSINDDKHCVEIRYTKMIGEEPEVILNGIRIDFEKSYKIFRRIYDGKNWRILMKIFTNDVCVKSVDGFRYKLIIGGIPFEKIKKLVTAKEWK